MMLFWQSTPRSRTQALLAGFSRALALAGALALAAPVFATPPRPPAFLTDGDKLTAEREWVLDRAALPLQVVMREQGIASLTLSAAVVAMEPGKPEFAAPRVLWRTEVKPAARDQSATVEVPLKGLKPGEWRLEVRLTGRKGANEGFSHLLVRYLVIDADGRIHVLSPQQRSLRGAAERQRQFDVARRSDERQHPIRLLFGDTFKLPADAKVADVAAFVPRDRRIEVRPAELTPFLREHSADSTATSYTSRDPITVRGRVVFRDLGGNFVPLVNVAIHLWDSDTFGDEHLGSVASDWDGRWAFTVNNDDGWFQDGRDLYYTIKLDTSRLSLGTCNFLAGAYEWKSAVHDDMSDGTVLDFGTETVSSDMDAARVWSTLNLAWNHAATAGGFDPGKIDGCFPGSGTFYNGKINIEGGDFDGPDSITHEYGHGVMAHAYSGGDPSPGGDHGFGDCGQNKALSWSEGWATAFMLTLRQDGRYNWHEGDGGQEIEGFSSSCQTGDSSEGRVAAALLDMFDTHNDSNGGDTNLGRNGASDNNTGSTVALATMLRDTMVGTQHSTVIEFWNDLAGELTSTQRPAAQTVMNYNWMPVILPSSCVATKVAATSLPDKEGDGVLAGLRRFRDHALLPWPGGRELANLYYRNSPEIALVLLRRPALLPDALAVMRHFSQMGDTLTTNRRFVEFEKANGPLITPEVHAAAQRIVAALAEDGSEGLRRDAQRLKTEFERLLKTRLSDVQDRAAKEKAALVDRGQGLPPIKRQEYQPGSKDALQDKRMKDLLERSVAPRK